MSIELAGWPGGYPKDSGKLPADYWTATSEEAYSPQGDSPRMRGQAILQQLDMWSETGPEPGLVHVVGWATNNELSAEEAVAAERAEVMGANYVYLRHFEDRPPTPQAYVYDLADEINASRNSVPTSLGCDLAELQRRLWNASHVPLAFVFLPSEVIILDCFREPGTDSIKPLAAIRLAGQASRYISRLKAFSARGLDDGTFWELSHGSKVRADKSAYECLIRELAEVLRKIRKRKLLPDRVARKVLLVFVLLKYLEERRDRQGQGVFPDGFFAEFVEGAKGLIDVMANASGLLSILDRLAGPDRFNGDVFRITDEERNIIAAADLRPIAEFLRGDMEGDQFHFWRRYDFRYLPVELVSSIYEEFVTKADPEKRSAKGAVYTPAYLVNFLLDVALPIGSGTHQVRVLDPACGSGVFLVGVFRRLVLRWRRQNEWKRPDLPVLKQILRDYLFGVDCDPDAVNVTIFSLSVALCDHLEPREIWEELHFDRLRDQNIIEGDFFEIVNDKRWAHPDAHFDLVVGNPPFKEKLTPAAKAAEVGSAGNRPPLPRKQLALLFLEQSMLLTKPGGGLCLIQPAGPLLYNPTAHQFRSYILNRWHVSHIFDFTHTCRVVFGPGGDVPFASIFMENSKPADKALLHLTIRRTRAAKEKLFFEVDHYDFHRVRREEATGNPYIWKANLLGGGRLVGLVRRLADWPCLRGFLRKRKPEGWIVSEGFILGSGGRPADFLTGHQHLPADALTEKGLDRSRIGVLQEASFHSTGRKEVYLPPHLLIKECIGADSRIPLVLMDEPLVFGHNIVGIHAPENGRATLSRVGEVMQTRLAAFASLALSPQFGVSRSSALLKSDLMYVPVGDDLSCPGTTTTEDILIDDVMGPTLEFRRKGEGSSAVRPPDETQLRDYGRVFKNVVGSVYPELNAGTPSCTDRHVLYPFWFGPDSSDIQLDESEDLDEQLDALTIHKHGRCLRIVRVLRVYQGNAMLLVKPRQLRYWLRSVAIRDADEVFEDLVQQGY